MASYYWIKPRLLLSWGLMRNLPPILADVVHTCDFVIQSRLLKVSVNSATMVWFCQRAYGHKDSPLLGVHLRTPDGRQGFYFRGNDKPPNSPELKLLDSLHLMDSYVFIMDYEVPD